MAGIIPSNLNSYESNFHSMVEQNHELKIGVVSDAHYPKDTGFPFPLYDVIVKQKQTDVLVDMVLKNCILKDSFGGFPDYIEYSLRVGAFGSQNDSGIVPTDNKLVGATVLVQSINGSLYNGIIVGAIHVSQVDDQDATVYPQGYTQTKEEDAPYLKFSFNGVQLNIKNDGTLRIRKTLPTDDKGNYPDNSNLSQGTEVQFGVNGELALYTGVNVTNDEPNGKNILTIDKDGTINMVCQNGQQIEIKDKDSNATFTLGSGDHPVALADKLENLYNQLLQQLSLLTVATGTGPSSTPLNASAFPNWDSSINSVAMKIPK